MDGHNQAKGFQQFLMIITEGSCAASASATTTGNGCSIPDGIAFKNK
jgi:hypothetical protein